MKLPAATMLSLAMMAPLTASWAGAEEEGVAVTASSEIEVRPNRLMIQTHVMGTGELTADALVKYRDAAKRLSGALEGLQLANLEVEQGKIAFQGIGVAEVPGGESAGVKTETAIVRTVNVSVSGIDRLTEDETPQVIGRLLDALRDAGLKLGPAADSNQMLAARMFGQAQSSVPQVTFVVDDASSQRKEAYQQAFSQARAQAEELAALAGAKLGRVLAVTETEAGPTQEPSLMENMMAIYGVRSAKKSGLTRLTADSYGPILLQVNLRVRFALEEKGDP